MRWSRGRGVGQVEDRRGAGRGGLAIGGGLGGMGIIGVLIAMFLGNFGGGGGGGFDIGPALDSFGEAGSTNGSVPPETDDAAQFVQFVIADVQETWTGIFEQS